MYYFSISPPIYTAVSTTTDLNNNQIAQKSLPLQNNPSFIFTLSDPFVYSIHTPKLRPGLGYDFIFPYKISLPLWMRARYRGRGGGVPPKFPLTTWRGKPLIHYAFSVLRLVRKRKGIGVGNTSSPVVTDIYHDQILRKGFHNL